MNSAMWSNLSLYKLRVSDSAAILATASFVVYRVFKSFEPDKPIATVPLLLVIPSLLVPLLHVHITNLPLAITATFTIYYTLILTYIAIYRLSPVHPLAKYPGPLKNKLSKLWMSYILSTGKQHVYLTKLHNQYGDVVRVGPNELSVNRVDALAPILGVPGMPKGPWWYNRVPPGKTSALISSRDPAEHRRRRKPWDRAFSSTSLREYEEIVVRRSRELLDAFDKRKGEELDLSAWMSYFAFDFMGDMVFGAGFDLMKNGEDPNGIWHTINGGIVLSAILGHIPWAYTFVRLIPGLEGARKRLIALADRWVKRRIQEGSKVKDLYYHLTDEEGHEAVKPTIPVVYSDGTLAIIAGSDTTASTFSAIWYYLLVDKRDNGGVVYERLRREVDEAFPAGEEPLDFSKMAGMEYLNGVINEALRLLPPVLSGAQRTAVPGSGGKMVGPYYIPENNHVFVHTHSIHRNPNYFSPQPNSFWPDRWLPAKSRQYQPFIPLKDTKVFINDQNAFVPFSMGPANCAGKNLALLELRALVCFLVQRFEFEAKEGFRLEDWEEGIKDYFTMMRPALPVRVQARRL